MNIPPEVLAIGPEAVAQYEAGHYHACRFLANQRLDVEGYESAAPSMLPLGDERGEGLPPVDCRTWRKHFVVRCSASTTSAGSVNYTCRFTPCPWFRF